MKVRRSISYLLHRITKRLDQHPDVPPLAMRYLLLLQDYSPNQIKSLLFHRVLETEIDGVVEMYEFIEIMILTESYQDKTIPQFMEIVKELSSGVISNPDDPKFGQNSTMVLKTITAQRRHEFREAFKFLDKQDTKDGVISEKDLLVAMERYVWL